MEKVLDKKKELEIRKKELLDKLVIIAASNEKVLEELNSVQKQLDLVDDEVQKIRLDYFYGKTRKDEVFAKSFIEGKTYSQIAKELFCTEDYVRKLVFQIRKEIKKYC